MAIYLGTKKVKDVYLGTSKVNKIYLGNDLVYESAKWRIVWAGLRLMDIGYYPDHEEYDDLCYPYSPPPYDDRNYFGLTEGVPTQVSARLHGCSDYGCIGYIVTDEVLDEIRADPSGNNSNLPWSNVYSDKVLYLQSGKLYQDRIYDAQGFYGAVVIVTEIWQKI